jgi:itaconate CoA-transferase
MDRIPALGEHTEAILSAMGYDAGRIAALRDEAAI